MGFIDLFVVKEQPQQQTVEIPTETITVIPQKPLMPSEVDEKMVNSIWETVIARNLPGPDYLEFKNNAAGLEGIISETLLRFKGAFNVIKQSYPSFSKDILLSSIDTYKGIVAEEIALGDKEFESTRKEEVGSKEVTIAQLEKSANDTLAKIEELKAEYNATLESITSLKAEVESATASLNAKHIMFINSANQVLSILDKDKEIITQM